MLEKAKRGIGGNGMSPEESEQLEAQMRAMIQRLQRGKNGGGGEQGPNCGQAEGGKGEKGKDDGRPDDPSKVKGNVDPRGNMGKGVRFKGVPRENDAKAEFKEAVTSAAKDAEEGVEEDNVPPEARPYVKRYFEALKER